MCLYYILIILKGEKCGIFNVMNKKDMKKIKPLKKKHTGLKIFLIVICVILVLPIAFVFAAFFDTTTKKVSDTEVHYENIVAQGFYNGVSKLSTEVAEGKDPVIGFKIDEEMIDGIMMAACDKINQKQWIPKMYCYIDDNNYTFVMDAQASFFKTRALIHTSLDKEDSTLVFKITGVTLGRLPIPLNWVTGILGNFINDDVLNKAFAQSGFHIQSHLADAKLTYSREQFKEDVGVYVAKLGDNSKFLNVLLSTFDNDKVLSTDYKDGVSVGINLKELQTPPVNKDAPIKFKELEEHRKEVTTLMNINNGVKEEDAPKVFTYLLRGNESSGDIMSYINNSSNEVKNALKTYIGGELQNYTGSTVETPNEDDKCFADYCKDTIQGIITPPESLDDSVTFRLPSDELNQVLASKLDDIVGMTIPITFKNDDTWDFQYITVDNVYTGFTPDPVSEGDNHQFNIYIQLNVAGIVPIKLVITTDNIGFEYDEEESNKLGHLKFKLKDINFGSINIKHISESVIDLLPSENNVFTFNKTKDQFEVSIDDLIPGETTLPISLIHEIIDSIPSPKPSLTDLNQTFVLEYTN